MLQYTFPKPSRTARKSENIGKARYLLKISLFVAFPPVVLRFCRETERGWAGLGVMGAGMGCPGIPEAEDASQEKAK